MMSGCATLSYRNTPSANFSGDVDVRWVENDYFLFIPSKNNPLKLIRSDGSHIRPGLMFTDGGSIPRYFWGVKGFSPWGYAPAYMIHDWMFQAHQCQVEPDNKYSFSDSIQVIAEALKASMEAHPSSRDYFVFDAIVGAIGSPIAEKVWNKGICKQPPATVLSLTPDGAPPGEYVMTIKFGQ